MTSTATPRVDTRPATTAAAALLTRATASLCRSPDRGTVADLARWLADQAHASDGDELTRELALASAETHRTGEGVVLAQGSAGHVLVVRYFPPHLPTPIHGHGGWGAVVVLDGIGRYQTWEPTRDGYARITEVRVLGTGDSLSWPDPPHDVHRQEGLAGGVTELTLFASHPYTTWAPQFQPAGDPPPGTGPWEATAG
jgi:hypothetical protein